MSPIRPLDALETDRLVLRHRSVDEADVFRRLWTERDERVPAHRRIDAEGRPTVDEIAAQIRAEGPGLRLLAVERKDSGDVIGYCAPTVRGDGPTHEPDP